MKLLVFLARTASLNLISFFCFINCFCLKNFLDATTIKPPKETPDISSLISGNRESSLLILKTSLWDFLRRILNKYKDKIIHIDHCSWVVINFIPLRMVQVNSNPVKKTCDASLQTTPEGSKTLNWYLLMKVYALKEKRHEHKNQFVYWNFPIFVSSIGDLLSYTGKTIMPISK